MFNELAELHKLCFPNKPWDANDFANLKKSGCEIIASQNGFVVYRAVADEAEIITIGVAPDARRTGIGIALIGVMEADLKKKGVNHIFLEVAADNTTAPKLYEQCGFVVVGRRPKYYGGVDAIMMSKDI